MFIISLDPMWIQSILYYFCWYIFCYCVASHFAFLVGSARFLPGTYLILRGVGDRDKPGTFSPSKPSRLAPQQLENLLGFVYPDSWHKSVPHFYVLYNPILHSKSWIGCKKMWYQYPKVFHLCLFLAVAIFYYSFHLVYFYHVMIKYTLDMFYRVT